MDRKARECLHHAVMEEDVLDRFDGKTAIITGGASGMGKATALRIASEGGIKGRANAPVYDISKAGLSSLSHSMAAGYVKYGIRVNEIAPGWSVTEFHYGKAADPEAKKKEMETMDTDYCLMRRLARPEGIASAIAFLASEDASCVTGTTLCVDGGRVGF